MNGIAGFISGLAGIQYAELLPLNHAASGKYDSLDMEYPAFGLEPPSGEVMEALSKVFISKELNVRHG